jgi:hypothetical protein
MPSTTVRRNVGGRSKPSYRMQIRSRFTRIEQRECWTIPQVIPVDAQDHFWSVVRRCLREFHTKQSPSALKKASRLRTKVEQLPAEDRELFYHDEPFDVACRLAGRRLKVEDHLKHYLKIRDDADNRCC